MIHVCNSHTCKMNFNRPINYINNYSHIGFEEFITFGNFLKAISCVFPTVFIIHRNNEILGISFINFSNELINSTSIE